MGDTRGFRTHEGILAGDWEQAKNGGDREC